MPSWSQKIEVRNFPVDFLHSEFFGAGWAAMPPLHWLLLCLRVCDITKFRPWSPIATGNHLDRAEKIPKVAYTTGTVEVLVRFRAFRDQFRGELSRVQIFMNEGPNPLMWYVQLLSYWLSRNPAVFQISSWILWIISGVVTENGSSRTRRIADGKITTFKLGHPVFWQCHTMVHIPLMFLPEWLEFPSAPCLTKKNLMTTRVSMLLKSRASPDMLPVSLHNKQRLAIRHMNRPLFLTTLSIPSYDMGK